MGNENSAPKGDDAIGFGAGAGAGKNQNLNEQLVRQYIMRVKAVLAAMGDEQRAQLLRKEPDDPNWKFDLTSSVGHAKLALELDDMLSSYRHYLVPQVISEDVFWRNYFWQVYSLKNRSVTDDEEAAKAAAAEVARAEAEVAEAPPEEPHGDSDGDAEPARKKKKKKKKKKKEPDGPDPEVENILLRIKECFVYRVPPLTQAAGHIAQSWGLDKPMWTGQARVIVKKGENLLVRFLEPDGRVYVESMPIPLGGLSDERPLEKYLEKVVDSSRYFVVQLKAPTGKVVPLGFGFRERSTSFDLTASIQDYLGSLRRHAAVPKPAQSGPSDDEDAGGHGQDPDAGPPQPGKYSLGDDEVISTTGVVQKVSCGQSSPPDLTAFTLAPPPD